MDASYSVLMRRHAVALAALTIAVVVNLAAHRLFEATTLFFLFMVAVGVSSAFSGVGNGLLTTLLSTAVVLILFTEPLNSVRVDQPADWLRLARFAVCGVCVTVGARWGLARGRSSRALAEAGPPVTHAQGKNGQLAGKWWPSRKVH